MIENFIGIALATAAGYFTGVSRERSRSIAIHNQKILDMAKTCREIIEKLRIEQQAEARRLKTRLKEVANMVGIELPKD